MATTTTLRQGSSGALVSTWQENLNKLGYKTDVDGKYGADTKAKTILFQKANGLMADGIAGIASQMKMVTILYSGTIPKPILTNTTTQTERPKPVVQTSQAITPSAPKPVPSVVYAVTQDLTPKKDDTSSNLFLYGILAVGGLYAVVKMNGATTKGKKKK